MTTDLAPALQVAIGVLFFPTFFQADWVRFAWGAGDPGWLLAAKRLWLLLPVMAVLLGCWLTTACAVSLVFRPRRREFTVSLLTTWWDLGKAVTLFWGGTVRFGLALGGAVWGLAKMIVVGAWLVILDVLLAPARLVRTVSRTVSAPGIAWVALALTAVWCLIEAVVFTHVMTPLVSDTLSGLTGEELPRLWLQVPLFLFLLFLVLGSYAVVAGTADAIRSRQALVLARIGVIQVVAAGVEILFFYRELVDSLVPWFAQRADREFELGVAGTLAIGTLAWVGVRGMTWFLFGRAGTPLMLAVIQGRGITTTGEAGEPVRAVELFAYTSGVFLQVKANLTWIRRQGEELVGAFVLPPLQVVAAAVNFATLLVTARHLFELPLRTLKAIESPPVFLVPPRRPVRREAHPRPGREPRPPEAASARPPVPAEPPRPLAEAGKP